MRYETVNRQNLRVLDLDALRSISRNGKHLRGERRTAFMLVVLLQKSWIDLLLLDLAICLVRAAFFHHHAGNANVRVPDSEVEDGCGLREREQVLAFENLG